MQRQHDLFYLQRGRDHDAVTQDRVRKKPLDKGVVIQQRIVEEVDIDAGQ